MDTSNNTLFCSFVLQKQMSDLLETIQKPSRLRCPLVSLFLNMDLLMTQRGSLCHLLNTWDGINKSKYRHLQCLHLTSLFSPLVTKRTLASLPFYQRKCHHVNWSSHRRSAVHLGWWKDLRQRNLLYKQLELMHFTQLLTFT